MSSPLKHFNLTGRRAVVTGGAGLLGLQFANTLADAGAQVVIFDVREPDLSFPLYDSKEVQAAFYRLDSHIVDMTNEEAVCDAFKRLDSPASILVNCAGIDTRPDAKVQDNGTLETYSSETWDTVIRSHLTSAFLASKWFLTQHHAGLTGSIVNVSSVYGMVSPDQSVYQYRRDRGEDFYKPVAYTVAKAGMIGLTKWLAEYGAPKGIRANTLVPGGVYANQEKEFVREYEKRTMLNRMATPSDCNGALLFLASDASSYMTGAELVVDGGWTAR